MKYSCGLIQDLLPLYLDNVCSSESRSAVEEHLGECAECRACYLSMQSSEALDSCACVPDREMEKAKSFQSLKKTLFCRQLLLILGAVLLLVLGSCAVVGVLKNSERIIPYENNIYVSITDGDLIGRLQGTDYTNIRIKRVPASIDGQEKQLLFFCASGTGWDALTTGSHLFSEFTLSYSDKGADQIDAVYYYTGEYTALEEMSTSQLQQVIDASACLWKK